MNKLVIISAVLLMAMPSAGQKIDKSSLRELPKDLATETILFLKFDSIDISDKKPANVYEKRDIIRQKNFNKSVPKLNQEFYEAVKSYPYKYKIGHMMGEGSDYKKQGAKYLFWMNSFDAIIWGDTYGTHGDTYYGSMLGIVDLTSNQTYLISKSIDASNATNYDKMMRALNAAIRKQFD